MADWRIVRGRQRCRLIGGVRGGGPTGDTIKIGYVTPLTGALAAFGEGDQYVVDQMTAFFEDHPIQAGGTSYGVEILLKDSQSDPKRAGEVAGEFINTDGVDILMAHATPETTVPVAAQCEANATPCITADTPWQPWVAGLGGNPGDPATALKWAYHFFWGLEDIAAVNMEVWNAVDDEQERRGALPERRRRPGLHRRPPWATRRSSVPRASTLNNPGLYPSGTQDFSAQIAAFKANDDQILTGIVPAAGLRHLLDAGEAAGLQPEGRDHRQGDRVPGRHRARWATSPRTCRPRSGGRRPTRRRRA